MASQVVAVNSAQVDLDNPQTFVRKTLTGEQADMRLRILEAKKDSLMAKKEDLSPRSLREYKELATVLSEDARPFTVKITREEPAQHYRIEFNQDPRVAEFKKDKEMIESLNTSLAGGGSQVGILRALVNPITGIEWYKVATLAQMNAVLKSDFLDSLKHGFIANLNLILAARNLWKNSEVSQNISKLHAEAFNLYQDNINFNRTCEELILANAQSSVSSLVKMKDCIQQCGARLETQPEDFIAKCNAVVIDEETKALELYKKIHASSEDFLKQLDHLKVGIEATLANIGSANKKITELLKQMKELNQKKNELQKAKDEVQTEYEAFQARLQIKEDEKANNNTSWNFFSGIKSLFQIKTTVLWIADQAQEAFATVEQWQKYRAVKNESVTIEAELKKLQKELNTQLREQVQFLTTQEDVEEAAKSLTAAFEAVNQIESAIVIRKSQAERQAHVMAAKLGQHKSGHSDIRGVNEALMYLEAYLQKVLNGHAIWVQSHRQCTTMQQVRSKETGLKMRVFNEIQEGKDDAVKELRGTIHEFLSMLEGGQASSTVQYHYVMNLTNEQMLAQLENG